MLHSMRRNAQSGGLSVRELRSSQILSTLSAWAVTAASCTSAGCALGRRSTAAAFRGAARCAQRGARMRRAAPTATAATFCRRRSALRRGR
jgi:hypothetical protein